MIIPIPDQGLDHIAIRVYAASVGQVPITVRTTPDGDRAVVADLRLGTVHVIGRPSGAVSTVRRPFSIS
ncbi:hypothetical protein ACWD5R_31495 [Streptomyces sp. NPDC002514]|uniref:hypothetical protein n=1 Tax=unclassified Streptomyces TaxID=2593676 RepID=UPI0036CC2806